MTVKINKALVTGGSGFVGSRLVVFLVKEEIPVRVFVRSPPLPGVLPPDVEVVSGDLRDVDSLRKAVRECDTVFHLAARVHTVTKKTGDDPLYHQVNLVGTENILKASAEAGICRFIFFSSVKSMGEGGGLCLDESSEPVPLTPYGKSKLAAEKLVHEFGRRFGMHTVCLRFPLIYGPGVKGNLQRMESRIESGFFPPLPEFGNKRSLFHCQDAARAALLVANKDEACGKTYIVTDGKVYSTRDLYIQMCRALGKPVPKWVVPQFLLAGLARLGDMFRFVFRVRVGFDSEALEKLSSSAWYSSGKISRELGFYPKFSFRVESDKATSENHK